MTDRTEILRRSRAPALFAAVVLVLCGPSIAQTASTPAITVETVPLETVPLAETEVMSDESAATAAETVEAIETTEPTDAAETIEPSASEAAPLAPPVPAGPPRIIIAGDNLAVGAARDIAETLSDVPDIEVERIAVGSSGLVRDDFHDWPANLKSILAEKPAAAVVLLIGANDRQPLRDDKGSHQPNSEDWLRLYTQRVEEITQIAKSAGVPLFWVEMPIMKSGSLTSTLTLTNAIFREKTEATGGTFVETWDQFADENGKYSRSGPDLTGTQRRLRTGDGIHFTKAGYNVLAHVIAKPLRQLAALQVSPAQDQAEVEALMLGSVGMTPGATEPSSSDPVGAGQLPAEGATLPAPLAGLGDTPGSVADIITGDAATAAPEGPLAPPSNVSIGEAPPVDTRPAVRQVRVGRPFLLTQPAAGEEALVSGTTRRLQPRASGGPAPDARADSIGLPRY